MSEPLGVSASFNTATADRVARDIMNSETLSEHEKIQEIIKQVFHGNRALAMEHWNEVMLGNVSEDEKKKYESLGIIYAVSQREADIKYSESFHVLKSITLDDYFRDWEGTFEKYKEATTKAWEKYDQGFATESDKQTLVKSITCTYESCQTPEHMERFKREDPRGNAFIEGLQHRLEMKGVFHPGMSEEEKKEKTIEAAKHLDPQIRDKLLEASKRIVSDNDIGRFNTATHEYRDIINKDYKTEMQAAVTEPDETIRKQKIEEVSQKAYTKMSNKDDAQFLAEKRKAFYNDTELSTMYQSITQQVTDYIVNSDKVANRITDVDRGQIINDIEFNGGRLKPETLDKVLPQMLKEIQKVDPTMTEAKLREMEKNDPQGFAAGLQKSISILDDKVEAQKEGQTEVRKTEYTFNFGGVESYFTKPASANMTPIEKAPPGVISPKPDKYPPDGIAGDVLAQLNAIKEKQDKMPATVEQARAETAKVQTPETSNTPAAPTTAQNPVLMASNVPASTGRGGVTA